MTVPARFLAGLVAFGGAFGAALLLPTAAAASGCASMTLQYGVPTTVIQLVPDHVSVAYRGCVSFTNQLATQAEIKVGSGYDVTLAAGESTGTTAQAPKNYVATTPDSKQKVAATSGPASTTGSVTVGPAPSPSPSPSRSTASPTPTSSSDSRTASPRPSSSGPAHRHRHPPTPAPQPTATPAPVPTLQPIPTGPVIGPPQPGTSPLVAPGATGPPGPQPSPSRSAAVVAGPIEPASPRGLGLPAALGALAVVGTAGALGRVLLTVPTDAAVDNRGTVGGSA